MEFTQNFTHKMLCKCLFIFFISQSFNASGLKGKFYNKKTFYIDKSDGDIYNLTHFNIQCRSNEGLQGFRLQKKHGMSYYDYKCESSININSQDSYFTQTELFPILKDRNKSSPSLTHHYLQCKEEYVLNGFRMVRYKNRIRFNYTCVRMNNIITSNQGSTAWTEGDYGSIQYLDLQEIKLKENQFMQGFNLNVHYYQTKGRMELSYAYRYCSVEKDSLINYLKESFLKYFCDE
jgi:hypothetical protein